MFKELRPLRINIHQAHLFGGVCERTPVPFWACFYFLIVRTLSALRSQGHWGGMSKRSIQDKAREVKGWLGTVGVGQVTDTTDRCLPLKACEHKSYNLTYEHFGHIFTDLRFYRLYESHLVSFETCYHNEVSYLTFSSLDFTQYLGYGLNMSLTELCFSLCRKSFAPTIPLEWLIVELKQICP